MKSQSNRETLEVWAAGNDISVDDLIDGAEEDHVRKRKAAMTELLIK